MRLLAAWWSYWAVKERDPVRRAAWRALSARAIADGNPALDYIGTGGPTPLRAPAVIAHCERAV